MLTLTLILHYLDHMVTLILNNENPSHSEIDEYVYKMIVSGKKRN